jgi:acetyltransferase-like isoleucine patch superfamily enzyme
MFSRLFTAFGRSHYGYLPVGLLIANYVFQRILRRNYEFPFSVHFSSSYLGAKNIIVQTGCRKSMTSFAVSGGCYFTAFEGTQINIGEGSIWAPNVCIQTGNHDFLDRDKYICQSVSIGKNCWLGFGSVVLAGVTLGDNVTVGANAVVTRSFPSNVVIAGVPAIVIRKL